MSYFVALSCANQFAGVDGSALSIVAALLFFSFRAFVISQISLSRCSVGGVLLIPCVFPVEFLPLVLGISPIAR
jgi:hypothetical protein